MLTRLQVGVVSVLVLAGLTCFAWFVATPDFYNATSRGLASVVDGGRAFGFFAIPLAGLAHLGLAFAVGKQLGGRTMLTIATIVCGLDLFLAVGAGLLAFSLRNFNMH